jgi:pimeloyl-ACP methyl ester carboxylesterase
MAQVHANGITLEYESHGEGEPLLLVMGLSAQLVAWPDEFVEQLVQRGFRVIRFDNRDSGLSTHSDQPPPKTRKLLAALLFGRQIDTPYTLADLTDDAAGLLDALGIASAHVVGVSMGGMIGQGLAIAHPGRVRSLTSIMSSTGDRRNGRSSMRLVARLLRIRRRLDDDPIGAGVELWRAISGPHFDEAETRDMVERAYARSSDPDGTSRQRAAIATAPDRTDPLGRVQVPVLVVHGLRDRLVKPSGGVATVDAVAQARLLMFPDMAHDLPRPRWAELANAIRANASRAVDAPID